MASNSSKSTFGRIIGWAKGFFSQGARQIDRGGGQQQRESRPDGTERQARTASQGAAVGTMAATSERQELPDLDDTESDYEYSGEPSDATRPPQQAGTGGPASEAAERIEEYRSERSDLTEMEGTGDDLDAPLPPDSTDPNEVYRVHNAVGGDEKSEDDDEGPIDTDRDTELASQHGDEGLSLDTDVSDVSEQSPESAAGGTSADEFAHGGYEPVHPEPEDIEAAAEGRPTDMEDDVSSSDTGDLQQHAGAYAGSQTIDDISLSADALDDGPDNADDAERTDFSGTEDATREEIELTNRGDAFVQGDEGVTAPGQSDPEAFDDVTTGTTEPSRSATGNDVDETPDALGTTLDYTEESSETFDPDSANLGREEEMSVSGIEPDEEPGSISGEESTRITTYRDDPVAREEVGGHVGDEETVDSPEQPYADIPDKWVKEPPEDSDMDDFSGSAYPSDRRIDRLAGDDPFDAVEPDIGEETSSAGDLDTPAPYEDLLISEEPPAEAADPGVSAGAEVDQEMISAADDSIGNAPRTLDMAEGTADGTVFDIEDEEASDATSLQKAEAEGTQATPQALTDDGGAGWASTRDENLPAGAVRGDGTTNTPEGYPVKGNANSKIYHLPNFPSYAGTKPELCFATEQDAINAGYRAPGKRNRGRGKRS